MNFNCIPNGTERKRFGDGGFAAGQQDAHVRKWIITRQLVAADAAWQRVVECQREMAAEHRARTTEAYEAAAS